MKIDQLLRENKEFDIEKFMSDCAPFLNAMKGTRAYPMRGIKTEHRNISWEIKDIRSDRKPRDTKLEAHKQIGAFLKKKFGWNPREEAMFITGDLQFATLFGQVYAVFPIGDFKMVWSPDIKDVTNAVDIIASKIISDLIADNEYSDKTREEQDKLDKWVESEAVDRFLKQKAARADWKTNDLVGALESGAEISIKASKYYAFDPLSPEFRLVKRRLNNEKIKTDDQDNEDHI